MITITFALDSENDGIEVRHDGKQVFWDNAPDGWTSYFQRMPRGVPVLLEFDNGDPREQSADDPRPYPAGESTFARLQRWLVDHSDDYGIRYAEEDEEGNPAEVVGPVTMDGNAWMELLSAVAERMYFYGADDVVEHYGIKR
jgi:hypothetical protein